MSGALELADEMAMSGAEFDAAGRGALAVMLRAAAELRRQHAVIEALAAIPDEIRGHYVGITGRTVVNEIATRIREVIAGGAS